MKFKTQNWKMLGSHNTHLMVFLGSNEHWTIKVFTHRYYRTASWGHGGQYCKDTLKDIHNKSLCGFELAIRFHHRRKLGVVFGGDSEYVRGRNRWPLLVPRIVTR